MPPEAPMTTMADDIGPRIAAVEADIRNINIHLSEINANQRQTHSEHQADIRALNDRINQTNDRITQTNDRITQVEVRLGSKVDRLTYVVLGAALTLLVGMALVYVRIGS